MKKINNYIIEKLYINKDTEIFNDDDYNYNQLNKIIYNYFNKKNDYDISYKPHKEDEFIGIKIIIKFKKYHSGVKLNKWADDISKIINEDTDYKWYRYEYDISSIYIEILISKK